MRKKEKWLLFVMPSLVKMRLSRLVSRDNRIIYNVLPLLMPGCLCPEQRGGHFKSSHCKKAAAQAVQQPYRCRAYSSMRMALTGQLWAAVTACGTSSGGMGPGSATARTPSMRNTAGHSPAHWVQPMHSSGSTNAFMQTPPCGKHCPFCRKLCLCKRFAVWYNKTAGNRQEETR